MDQHSRASESDNSIMEFDIKGSGLKTALLYRSKYKKLRSGSKAAPIGFRQTSPVNSWIIR